MAPDKDHRDQVDELKKQVDLLQQQLAVITAQVSLDAAKQTQEAQTAKAVSETLKNQAAAQFALESERAKLPLAELAGVKEALAGAQLPTGRNGSITVAAGTAGTLLPQSKFGMLGLLGYVADEFVKIQPEGAVLVNAAQLDLAYRAKFTKDLISDRSQKLSKAIDFAPLPEAKPPEAQPPVAGPMVLGEVMGGAYALGLVLDTVNSFGKLLRVDRKIDIFAADEEAQQLLGYLLQSKNEKFVADPAMLSDAVHTEAQTLLNALNGLLGIVHSAEDRLARLKKIEETEAAEKTSPSRLPPSHLITDLKAQTEAARTVIDGLHPVNKPDVFWAQVKGQLIRQALAGRHRLILETKAQALQITENFWWRSDRIRFSGAVQIAYRILDPTGAVKKTGVILKSSSLGDVNFRKEQSLSFPPSEG